MEYALWWSYVLLGPVAWLGLAIVGVFARVRMGRLIRGRDPLPQPAPSLEIAVPARNERDGIADCVTRLLAQDYPDLTLHVVDDRSTDGTGDILNDLARQHPRLRVTHVRELPAGWLGKPHALHTLLPTLRADWVLFVDSDVKLEPQAAARMVALAQSRGYDLLSALPTLHVERFWEGLLLPPLAVAWLGAFTGSLTNDDSKPHIALANGQLMLVRRAWYERVGGHGAVRDRIVEDVEFARLLKSQGAVVRLMLGQHLGTTRMHDTLHRIFHGWARVFAGTSRRRPGRILVVMLFLLICTGSLFVAAPFAIAAASWLWGVPALVHAALVLSQFAQMYAGARLGIWRVLLLPLTLVMLLAVLVFALRACRHGRVEWRGARVQV